MLDRLKAVLRRTPFFGIWSAFRQEKIIRKWVADGKPVPPPHIIKQRTILTLARKTGIKVFVETGTFLGEMVYAVKDAFEEIFSIELSGSLQQKAAQRFAGFPHIHILPGDSGEILGQILAEQKKPCLFWLDGHFSDDITAKGETITPIQQELRHIANHPPRKRDVILIDDARLFNGEWDYPPIETIREWAAAQGYDRFEVEDDIIRIYFSWGKNSF